MDHARNRAHYDLHWRHPHHQGHLFTTVAAVTTVQLCWSGRRRPAGRHGWGLERPGRHALEVRETPGAGCDVQEAAAGREGQGLDVVLDDGTLDLCVGQRGARVEITDHHAVEDRVGHAAGPAAHGRQLAGQEAARELRRQLAGQVAARELRRRQLAGQGGAAVPLGRAPRRQLGGAVGAQQAAAGRREHEVDPRPERPGVDGLHLLQALGGHDEAANEVRVVAHHQEAAAVRRERRSPQLRLGRGVRLPKPDGVRLSRRDDLERAINAHEREPGHVGRVPQELGGVRPLGDFFVRVRERGPRGHIHPPEAREALGPHAAAVLHGHGDGAVLGEGHVVHAEPPIHRRVVQAGGVESQPHAAGGAGHDVPVQADVAAALKL